MSSDGRTQFRPFSLLDYRQAVTMVIDTWQFYKWVPGNAARAMGDYYLCDILSQSDVALAALDGGELVGLMCMKDRRLSLTRFHFRLRKWLACLKLLLRGHGQSEFLQFIKTEALDRELLASSGVPFDAELTLLLVRADHKGRGIGGALYQAFLDEVKRRGLSTFCLFTDSSCNYHFYDHCGLYQLGEKTFYWKNGKQKKGSPEEYYLYGNVPAAEVVPRRIDKQRRSVII